MSAFKDATWDERFREMGDTAEAKFELYATNVLKRKWTRYGLKRPEIQMYRLPAEVRYTPDYLMTNYLVEVQGLGQDQRFKLKLDKWRALHWWNGTQDQSFQGVRMYVWDSHREREAFFHLSLLDSLLSQGRGSLDIFPEGKAYFQFAADEVFLAVS